MCLRSGWRASRLNILGDLDTASFDIQQKIPCVQIFEARIRNTSNVARHLFEVIEIEQVRIGESPCSEALQYNATSRTECTRS